MTTIHFSSTSTLTGGSRWLFCLATILAVAGGCGSSNQRLTQLQNENDRLLSEYRAQRDQVTQLNEKLAVAQNRLAESEKLLARQSPMPSSRLSRLNDPNSLPSSVAFGSQSRGSNRGSTVAGPGGTASKNASAGNTGENASSAADLYWRPMRREAP